LADPTLSRRTNFWIRSVATTITGTVQQLNH
jgi:hypothetical protein